MYVAFQQHNKTDSNHANQLNKKTNNKIKAFVYFRGLKGQDILYG